MYDIRRYLSFNQRTGLDSIIPHMIFDKLLKFSEELQQDLPALCVIITQKVTTESVRLREEILIISFHFLKININLLYICIHF